MRDEIELGQDEDAPNRAGRRTRERWLARGDGGRPSPSPSPSTTRRRPPVRREHRPGRAAADRRRPRGRGRNRRRSSGANRGRRGVQPKRAARRGRPWPPIATLAWRAQPLHVANERRGIWRTARLKRCGSGRDGGGCPCDSTLRAGLRFDGRRGCRAGRGNGAIARAGNADRRDRRTVACRAFIFDAGACGDSSRNRRRSLGNCNRLTRLRAIQSRKRSPQRARRPSAS